MLADYPSGDLLLGGRAIADFVNTLMDEHSQVTPGQVYEWSEQAEQGYFPTRRIGARIVASKSTIRRFLFPIEQV